jgi:hypothetical protein
VSRPPTVSSPEEFKAAADAYMDRADADDKFVPTVNGLALALGFNSRQSLLNYADKPEFVDTVKAVRARLEAWWEQRLAGGNAAGTIFWLKNQGWTDKTETELSGKGGKDLFPARIEVVAVNPE